MARIQRGAVSAVFGRHFAASQFENLVARFEEGTMLEVGESMPASTYVRAVAESTRPARSYRGCDYREILGDA